VRAAHACLARAGLRACELERVVFFERPARGFQRFLAGELAVFPRSAARFGRELGEWLGRRLWIEAHIAESMDIQPERVTCIDHLLAHAAASALTSPFDDAAVWIADDAGDWTSSCLAHARRARIDVLEELWSPHAPAALDEAVARYLGFDPELDPHAVEVLAQSRRPRFTERLLHLLPAPGAPAAERAFDYAAELRRMFAPARAELADDALAADVATSWQAAMEQHALQVVERLAELTRAPALCFGGRLALNRALVARIAGARLFEHVHVPSDPDDAGAVVGAALLVSARDRESGARGSAWLTPTPRSSDSAVLDELVERLAAGQLVAWQRRGLTPSTSAAAIVLAAPQWPGAAERLRRALCVDPAGAPARLILDARAAHEWLDDPPGARGALESGRIAARPASALARLAPEIGHTVWPRAVDSERDGELCELLRRFEARTTVPALLESPFALRGFGACEDESDAREFFARADLDALLVGQRIDARVERPAVPAAGRRATTNTKPASGSEIPSISQ
jgi:carbamoyltransferase